MSKHRGCGGRPCVTSLTGGDLTAVWPHLDPGRGSSAVPVSVTHQSRGHLHSLHPHTAHAPRSHCPFTWVFFQSCLPFASPALPCCPTPAWTPTGAWGDMSRDSSGPATTAHRSPFSRRGPKTRIIGSAFLRRWRFGDTGRRNVKCFL